MKRVFALVMMLCLLPVLALADEAVIEWFMIEDQIRTGENGVVSVTDDDGNITHAVYVRVKGSVYTIFTHESNPGSEMGAQAVIAGVQIDARDTQAHQFYVRPNEIDGIAPDIIPSAAGTYVFENVVISGDIRVFAYESCDVKMKNPEDTPQNQIPVPGRSPVTHYAVRLDETVTLLDGTKIQIKASDAASMDKYGTEWHRFHGGSVDFEMHCGAEAYNVDLISMCGGVIDAEITGETKSIGLTSYIGSDVTVRNLAAEGEQDAQGGSVYVSVSEDSKGEMINERDLQSLVLECVDDSKLTAENNADVCMLEFHTEVDSQIKFTNNGVIKNSLGNDGWSDDGNSWGDQAVMITIDETSHLNIVGKGTIMPGYQRFDYYLGHPDVKFETPKPGASVIIDLKRSDFELGSYAENVEMARKVAKRVSFDWKQIEKGREGFVWTLSNSSEAPPHSVLAVQCGERAFIWPVTKTNEYHPALVNEQELDVLPADYDETGEERSDAPKVLLGEEPSVSTDVYLSINDQGKGEGVVRYELEMIDAWGSEYDPGKTVQLFLPYPDIADAEQREYEVYHTLKNGNVEYYSTLGDTIRKLDNGKGMVVDVRTFSPFEIRWAEGADSLPDTGDNSHLALWLMMMGMAGAAILVLRRRAHG